VEPLDPTIIRHYIALARRHEPIVPVELMELIVEAYAHKRMAAHEAQYKKNADYIYTQPRTLLAILRMSQALARLRFSDVIEMEDVREALRLMDAAKVSLDADHGKSGRQKSRDPKLEYYHEIKKLARERGVKQLLIDDIRNRLRLTDGYDEVLLNETIEQYENINVWGRIGQSLVFV
jgi:DNA replication licensing factor MCM7